MISHDLEVLKIRYIFDNGNTWHMLIKVAITYCENIIGSLPYLVMKFLNFTKNVFLSLVFLSLVFFFQFRAFFYFLFSYSFGGSELSWYFLFIAEFLLLFLIEFLFLFLQCNVQPTLMNWI